MKCIRCGTENIELTSINKVTIGRRIKPLFIGIIIATWFIMYLKVFGAVIGMLIILVAFVKSFDPRKVKKTYHCKICNKVFKKGWGYIKI